MSNFSLTMSNNNKRQRTTSSNRLCFNDLPDGLLVGISRYLAKPSVALFAIAMATTNSQEQTQTTKAIISAIDWSVLDFGDIEKILASKLSDGVIDKILRNIDAVNDLQILKLAGCVNISGIGLNVLRSSVVIKQIDLSLVGKHEVPVIEPDPLLSEDLVIPILDSVINGGSSLKQLEFDMLGKLIVLRRYPPCFPPCYSYLPLLPPMIAVVIDFVVNYNDCKTHL